MSHDEVACEKSKRTKPVRREWYAGDYFRPDWGVDHLIEMLESRARGYNGLLRSVLCTAAQRLRDQNAALRDYEIEVAGSRAEAELVEEHWDKKAEEDGS